MIIRKDILQTSKVILLFEVVYKKYSLLEERFDEICKNSVLYTKTKIVFSGMAVIFQNSFLGRITEIKEEDNLKEILGNSRFVKCLLKLCNGWRKRIMEYLKTSFIAKFTVAFKNEFCIFPVKTGSIIVVTAILSNIFFYALFRNAIRNEIGLLGWIIKGMLLFVGLAGLFCEVDLKNLISTSLFLKWINHNRQSELEEK